VHVTQIETMSQEPTLGVLEKLAKALRVKPGQLLDP